MYLSNLLLEFKAKSVTDLKNCGGLFYGSSRTRSKTFDKINCLVTGPKPRHIYLISDFFPEYGTPINDPILSSLFFSEKKSRSVTDELEGELRWLDMMYQVGRKL